MAVYALLRSNPSASAEEIEAGLDGNLCRCTGMEMLLIGSWPSSHVLEGWRCVIVVRWHKHVVVFQIERRVRNTEYFARLQEYIVSTQHSHSVLNAIYLRGRFLMCMLNVLVTPWKVIAPS